MSSGIKKDTVKFIHEKRSGNIKLIKDEFWRGCI